MILNRSQWRRAWQLGACLLLSFVLVAAFMSDADAARKKRGTVRGKRPAAARVLGVNDPRYADIIMNPVTGEVYHQTDPDERRYPASLTKMMTLYLLFEALAQNKTTLDAHLDISDYATTMPQTHLSLSAGDTIPVEIAIKALVVRSANDVAVVVGEALGGDVDHFAQMMTAKARQLGMKNTVFKNPNGLPNAGQYTTARDMAKLGIALKRDFPQYYDYFATRQFSYNGVTYYTHNRVMLRYPGTDGIKTGYIGLSGFNVVSSVVRGGRPVVGTVMGGGTGGWRDNRMIELLDQSYQIIASRGAARGKIYPDNLPLQKDPKTGKLVGKGINAKPIMGMDVNEYAATLPEDQVKAPGDGSAEDGTYDEPAAEENAPAQSPFAVAQSAPPQAPTQAPTAAPVTAAAPVAAAPVITTTVVDPSKPNYIRIVSVPPKTPAAPSAPAAPVAKPAPTPLPKVVQVAPTPQPAAKAATPAPAPVQQAQPAPIQKPTVVTPVAPTPVTPIAPSAPVVATPIPQTAATATAAATNGAAWGIQVGAFTSNELATKAAQDAYNLSKSTLSGARMSLAGPESGGAPVHRARLVNITEKQAKDTCKVLIAHSTPCFTFKAE